jgi:O-antigen ligase
LSEAAFPKIQPYDSIDNEYLFLWVIQGKVGLALFILIVLEGAIAIIRAILRARARQDACFYYCLGGMLAGLLIVLITVYMSWQQLVLLFLCVGWSQSLCDQFAEAQPSLASKFNFRRVFA